MKKVKYVRLKQESDHLDSEQKAIVAVHSKDEEIKIACVYSGLGTKFESKEICGQMINIQKDSETLYKSEQRISDPDCIEINRNKADLQGDFHDHRQLIKETDALNISANIENINLEIKLESNTKTDSDEEDMEVDNEEEFLSGDEFLSDCGEENENGDCLNAISLSSSEDEGTNDTCPNENLKELEICTLRTINNMNMESRHRHNTNTIKMSCELCQIFTFSNLSEKIKHFLKVHNINNMKETIQKKTPEVMNNIISKQPIREILRPSMVENSSNIGSAFSDSGTSRCENSRQSSTKVPEFRSNLLAVNHKINQIAFIDCTDEDDLLPEESRTDNNKNDRLSPIAKANKIPENGISILADNHKINQIAIIDLTNKEDLLPELGCTFPRPGTDQKKNYGLSPNVETNKINVQKNKQPTTTSTNESFSSNSPSNVDDMLTYIEDLISEISNKKIANNVEDGSGVLSDTDKLRCETSSQITDKTLNNEDEISSQIANNNLKDGVIVDLSGNKNLPDTGQSSCEITNSKTVNEPKMTNQFECMLSHQRYGKNQNDRANIISKPHELKCEICKVTFSNLSKKKRHYLTIHENYKKKNIGNETQSMTSGTANKSSQAKCPNNKDVFPLGTDNSNQNATYNLEDGNGFLSYKVICEISSQRNEMNLNTRDEDPSDTDQSLCKSSRPKPVEYPKNGLDLSLDNDKLECTLKYRNYKKNREDGVNQISYTDKLICEICKTLSFSNISNKRRHYLKQHNILYPHFRKITTADELRCETSSQRIVSKETDELRCGSSSANSTENSHQKTSTSGNDGNVLSDELSYETSSQRIVSNEKDELRCENSNQKTSMNRSDESVLPVEINCETSSQKIVPSTKLIEDLNKRGPPLTDTDKLKCTSSHPGTDIELNIANQNEIIRKEKQCISRKATADEPRTVKSFNNENDLCHDADKLVNEILSQITTPNLNDDADELSATDKSRCDISSERSVSKWNNRGDHLSDCDQSQSLRNVDCSNKDIDKFECSPSRPRTERKNINKLSCEICNYLTFSNMSNKKRHYLRVHNIAYQNENVQKKRYSAMRTNIAGEIRSIKTFNSSDSLLSDNACLSKNVNQTTTVSLSETVNDKIINNASSFSDHDIIDYSMPRTKTSKNLNNEFLVIPASKKLEKIRNNAFQILGNELLSQKNIPSSSDDAGFLSVTDKLSRVISSERTVTNVNNKGELLSESYQSVCEFSRSITINNYSRTVIPDTTVSAVMPFSYTVNLSQNANQKPTYGDSTHPDGDKLECLLPHSRTEKNLNDEFGTIPSSKKLKTINNAASQKLPIKILSQIIIPKLGNDDVIISSTDQLRRDISCERNDMNINSIGDLSVDGILSNTASLSEIANNKTINGVSSFPDDDKIECSLPRSRTEENLNDTFDVIPSSKKLKTIHNDAYQDLANELLSQKTIPNSAHDAGYLSETDKVRRDSSSERTVMNVNKKGELSPESYQPGCEVKILSQTTVPNSGNDAVIISSTDKLRRDISCEGNFMKINSKGDLSSDSNQSGSEFSSSITAKILHSVDRILSNTASLSEIAKNKTINGVSSFPDDDKIECSLPRSRTEKNLNDKFDAIPSSKKLKTIHNDAYQDLADELLCQKTIPNSGHDAGFLSETDKVRRDSSDERTVMNVNKKGELSPESYQPGCEVKILSQTTVPNSGDDAVIISSTDKLRRDISCERNIMKINSKGDLSSDSNQSGSEFSSSITAKILHSIDSILSNTTSLSEIANNKTINCGSSFPDDNKIECSLPRTQTSKNLNDELNVISATKKLKAVHKDAYQNLSNELLSQKIIPNSGHDAAFLSDTDHLRRAMSSERTVMKGELPYQNYQSEREFEFFSSRIVNKDLRTAKSLNIRDRLLPHTANVSENANHTTANEDSFLPDGDKLECSDTDKMGIKFSSESTVINMNKKGELSSESYQSRCEFSSSRTVNNFKTRSDLLPDNNKFNQRCEFCKYIKFTDMSNIKSHYLKIHNIIYKKEETLSHQ